MSGNQNESFEAPSQPPLCANNCGFFANPNGSGLCSKCFQNQLSRQEREKRTSELATETAKNVAALVSTASAQVARPANPTPASAEQPVELPSSSGTTPMEVVVEAPSTSTAAAAEVVAAAEASPPATQKTNRCQQCRKKVGLNGFACRCGMTFCAQHRYAEAHCCTFDYKTMERRKLAETNPLVQASKIQKL